MYSLHIEGVIFIQISLAHHHLRCFFLLHTDSLHFSAVSRLPLILPTNSFCTLDACMEIRYGKFDSRVRPSTNRKVARNVSHQLDRFDWLNTNCSTDNKQKHCKTGRGNQNSIKRVRLMACDCDVWRQLRKRAQMKKIKSTERKENKMKRTTASLPVIP